LKKATEVKSNQEKDEKSQANQRIEDVENRNDELNKRIIKEQASFNELK